MLNDSMRRKLLQLAREDAERLDPRTRDRIVQRVVAAAPLEIRRARRMRLVTGGSAALAAAAGIALVIGLGTQLDGSASPAAAGDRACAEQTLPSALAFAPAPAQGKKELRVGDWASAVASADSRVALEQAEPCRLALRLDAGRLDVTAPDLAGGEFRVAARDADVVSRGAVFAVVQSDREITVEVSKGRVLIERHATGPREVSAGQRVSLSPSGVVEGQLGR